MAKAKKVHGDGLVSKIMDKVTHHSPQGHYQGPTKNQKNDSLKANEDIKSHAKFDKFKKGDELNGN